MKRVYSSELLAEVVHCKHLLEHEGIACLVKNERLSSALGEVPFLECLPELWVVDDADAPRAAALLEQTRHEPAQGAPWRCAACGERNEPQYGACWRCGTRDPAG